MTPERQARLAEYSRISREEAAKIDAVRAAAGQEYDRKMKLAWESCTKVLHDPNSSRQERREATSAYTDAMRHYDSQRDSAIHKAEHISHPRMMAAWYMYVDPSFQP
jgi:hypothetical protein